MTPQEDRNRKLAEHLIKNLNRRNLEAYYCPTGEEAVRKVSELIADGSTVTWGGTATVRDLGIPEALKSRGTLNVLDRDLVETPEEKQQMYLRAFTADVYLTSANALSEDGVIVNIDGNGNRVAAISWGPKKVIFVVGLNKVTQTPETALARARSTASPINAQRFDIKTPCKTDGTCHNCNSPESICSYVHFLRNSRSKGRHVVVLVGEDLGY
jgi:L-lactate utilization protein LutB